MLLFTPEEVAGLVRLYMRNEWPQEVLKCLEDPPYGIKYSNNFQPRTDQRDVKDKDFTCESTLYMEMRYERRVDRR